MQEEKKKIISQWFFPTIVLVAVLAGMLYNFTSRSEESAAAAVESDMIQISEKYAMELQRDLTSMVKTAMPVGLAIGRMGEIDLALLTELCNHSSAYMAVYCNVDGSGITQDGTTVNLAGEEYFTKLMDVGEGTYLYTEDDKLTGIRAAVYAVSIPGDSENMLLLYYDISDMEVSIKNEVFDFESNYFYALHDSEGNFLYQDDFQSEFLKGTNLVDILGHEYTDDIRTINVRLNNELSGSMEAVVNGEAKTLVFSPVGINKWVVTVGINQEYVDRQEQKQWEFTRRTLFQLVIVVCIFLIILVLINAFSKMRNTESTKELMEKADTDLLTGLNNKLATERKIKEFMETSPNEQSMLFVLDIDNFKKINDTMGHAFGDEVLRSLGQQITAMFRVTDIVGRTGGDEFIIFIKSLKEETIIKKEAEKVARFFHDFKTGEYVKYSATASIGVAIFPRDGKDFETMYKAADQALYMAKKRGKNQLAFYHDELEPVVIK